MGLKVRVKALVTCESHATVKAVKRSRSWCILPRGGVVKWSGCVCLAQGLFLLTGQYFDEIAEAAKRSCLSHPNPSTLY
eukprot:5553606-Karenia_brevis.AAC.1